MEMNQHYFTNLLMLSIGRRTKKAYADEIGISPEYLSRLTSITNTTVPSRELLERIVKNSESKEVTLDKLLVACGYKEKVTPLSFLKDLEEEKKNLFYGGRMVAIKDTTIEDGLNFYFNVLGYEKAGIDFKIFEEIRNYSDIGERESAIIIMGSAELEDGDMDFFIVVEGHWSINETFYMENIIFDKEKIKGILKSIDVQLTEDCFNHKDDYVYALSGNNESALETPKALEQESIHCIEEDIRRIKNLIQKYEEKGELYNYQMIADNLELSKEVVCYLLNK